MKPAKTTKTKKIKKGKDVIVTAILICVRVSVFLYVRHGYIGAT
jgi:hypothetical protein